LRNSALEDSSLKGRRLPDYTLDTHTVLWLVYPKSNVLTTKVRVFIDFLMEEIGNDPVWMKPTDS